MNTRPRPFRAVSPLLLLLIQMVSGGLFGFLALSAAAGGTSETRLPTIDPDYCGVVIPPNIAPLDFRIQEPGRSFAVPDQGDGRSAD